MQGWTKGKKDGKVAGKTKRKEDRCIHVSVCVYR
jgi:hypothetical protein